MSQYNEKKKNAPKPAEAAMRYYSICCNTRPVARKNSPTEALFKKMH